MTDEEILLRRYYDEGSPERAAPLLDRLLQEQVLPTLCNTVRARMAGGMGSSEDIEDLVARGLEAVRQSLLRTKQEGGAIAQLVPYAVTVAGHECDQYFRDRFPAYSAALARVLCHLRSNALFYKWVQGKIALGSLSVWPSPPPLAGQDRLTVVDREPVDAYGQILNQLREPPMMSNDGKPSTPWCMWAALAWGHGAFPVDSLVRVVQVARNEFDLKIGPIGLEEPPPPSPEVEFTEQLAQIWDVVKGFSCNKARALLLNLRMGASSDVGLELFVESGVTKLEELAALLDIEAGRLSRLLGLDGGAVAAVQEPLLPWPDTDIGQLMGCKAQDVANLRSAARLLLDKRLKERRRSEQE